MVRSFRMQLARLGERSPVRLAIAYACVALPLSALARAGVVDQRRVLVVVAVFLWVVASLGVVLVEAFYRDAPAISVGVTAALSIGIANLAVRALVDVIQKRSIASGAASFVTGLGQLALAFVGLVVVCIALVWVARRATAPRRDLTPDPGEPEELRRQVLSRPTRDTEREWRSER